MNGGNPNWFGSVGQGIGNWWDQSTSDGGWLTGQSAFGGKQYGQIGTDQSGNAIMGQTQSSGWVSPLTQALGSGVNAWLGMQQLDLAKDQLGFQKQAFQTNLANQTQLTNQAMYDRARQRASYAGQDFTQSFSEWEKQHGLGRK